MSTNETPSFSGLLAQQHVLIADGATGTNYQAMGMEPGLAPEEWLFQAPEQVVELHRAFVAAGADILLTCTFGATPLRLAEGPLEGRARDVNVRAAELAREGAGSDRLVAGSLGPTGRLIEPYGLLNREDAVAAYAEQAQALADGGVDLLVLETIFAVEEAVWAVEGVQSVTDLPLVVSFSFDMGTRTMMGLSPADAVAAVVPFGVAAVGTNCGRSLADADLVVTEILAAAGDTPVWVKPNAGVPKIVGAEVVYEAGPEMLAEHAARYVNQGVRIVGGCCGSTPPTLRRSHRLSAASRTCPLLHARAASCSTSPRCRPAGSTRTHTASSTGSSQPASHGGNCCRCTSPTRSARRTRPGRRSPVTKGSSRFRARRCTTTEAATRGLRRGGGSANGWSSQAPTSGGRRLASSGSGFGSSGTQTIAASA